MLPFLVTVAEILLYKKPFAVLTTCSVAGAEETVNGTVNARFTTSFVLVKLCCAAAPGKLIPLS